MAQGWSQVALEDPGLGTGFSSVSLAGNRVFTMGDKDGKSHVSCVDRTSGEKLWSTPVGKAGRTNNYAGTRCTPTVDGDRVYALGQFGDLVCLDTANGKEVWHKNFPADFGGRAGGWNVPRVGADRRQQAGLHPGGKDAIVALDKKTGKGSGGADFKSGPATRRSAISAPAASTVRPAAAGGVVSESMREDGGLLWKYERLGKNTGQHPQSPIPLGRPDFATAGYGKGGALLTIMQAVARSGGGRRSITASGSATAWRGVGSAITFTATRQCGQTVVCRMEDGPPEADWLKKDRRQKGQGFRSPSFMPTAISTSATKRHHGAGRDQSPKGYVEKGSFKIPGSDL